MYDYLVVVSNYLLWGSFAVEDFLFEVAICSVRVVHMVSSGPTRHNGICGTGSSSLVHPVINKIYNYNWLYYNL